MRVVTYPANGLAERYEKQDDQQTSQPHLLDEAVDRYSASSIVIEREGGLEVG